MSYVTTVHCCMCNHVFHTITGEEICPGCVKKENDQLNKIKAELEDQDDDQG